MCFQFFLLASPVRLVSDVLLNWTSPGGCHLACAVSANPIFLLSVCFMVVCLPCLRRPEEGIRSPGTRFSDGGELPCRSWESNPCPGRAANALNCSAISPGQVTNFTMEFQLSHHSFIHSFFSSIYSFTHLLILRQSLTVSQLLL